MSSAANRRKAVSDLITKQGVAFTEPPLLLPANPFFDLAGEEFGSRLLLTNGANDEEYCLRPDFTLPIASQFLQNGTNENGEGFGYLGSIFRQRVQGPVEFTQAGIEFLGFNQPDIALEKTFNFALKALKIYGIKVDILLGSVAIFEKLLNALNIPDVWQTRICHRFGQPKAMNRLLDRLAKPLQAEEVLSAQNKQEFIAQVSEKMIADGLSLTGSRSPEEIANRYYEKQQLAASPVSADTLNILHEYLAIKGNASDSLHEIEALAKKYNLDILAPVERLKKYIEFLKTQNQVNSIEFDASFSPRLDYYTGIVFQMLVDQKTIASGGEYDRLLERLGAEKQMNATGCAIWIDRAEEARK